MPRDDLIRTNRRMSQGLDQFCQACNGLPTGLNRRIPASCVPCKIHNWDRWCDWAWGVHSSNRTATSAGARHHGCDACGNGISTVASLEDTFYQPLNYSKHPVYVRPPRAVDSTGARGRYSRKLSYQVPKTAATSGQAVFIIRNGRPTAMRLAQRDSAKISFGAKMLR